MVEILFGESSAGSMKAAKCDNVEYKNGQPLWIQGSSDEVICLGFMLDMGYIGEVVDSQYRKDLSTQCMLRTSGSRMRNMKMNLRNLAMCTPVNLQGL